jgi:hypothetical protein
MAEWFTNMVTNPDWVRLNQWESLELGDDPVVEEDARAQRWAVAVARVRAEQAAGRLDPGLDADLVVLTLVALANFPVAFPPLTRMITGANPSDTRFQRRYAGFLRRLSAHLTS